MLSKRVLMRNTDRVTNCAYHVPIYENSREEDFVECPELHKKNPHKVFFSTSDYCVNCHLRGKN